MTTDNRTPADFSRRAFLKTSATSALGGGLLAGASRPANAADKSTRSNVIAQENAKEGTIDWQLTRVRLDKSDGFRSPFIEGYCSRQSVKAGETIDIMVSTAPAAKFTLEIFRTGYYGGKGARLMKVLGPFDGKAQPMPTPGEKDLHECKWEPTTKLTIPEDWVSGVYLGRLTTLPEQPDKPYWQSYVIFIVRDERPADILFQCSDNTWQAYNRWPTHYSVYTHPKGNQGPWADVSFDRPYGRQSQYTGIVNDPLSVGSGEFTSFEQPLSSGWSSTAMT